MTTPTKKNILIMAGGTGGHVFPALAIAKALQTQGFHIDWLGTANGIEARLVPEANIPLHYITINGIRGKTWKTKLISPFKIIQATWQAAKIIRQLKPQAIVGLGGFASGPGGIAAFLLKIPLYIHEQNAAAGMTNKILSHFSKKIMHAFPNTFSKKLNPILTGNPVRDSILNLPSPETRFHDRTGPLRILLLGGSGGASALNQVMPETLKLLPEGFCECWHQTGATHFKPTKQHYENLHVTHLANVAPFIQDMAEAYAWADLVICRSGALTVAELAAAGVASILIPFPFAVDDHQTLNANYLVEHDAALLLPQKQLRAISLAKAIQSFSRQHLLEKAKKAYELRLPDATALVVKNIVSTFT